MDLCINSVYFFPRWTPTLPTVYSRCWRIWRSCSSLSTTTTSCQRWRIYLNCFNERGPTYRSPASQCMDESFFTFSIPPFLNVSYVEPRFHTVFMWMSSPCRWWTHYAAAVDASSRAVLTVKADFFLLAKPCGHRLVCKLRYNATVVHWRTVTTATLKRSDRSLSKAVFIHFLYFVYIYIFICTPNCMQ